MLGLAAAASVQCGRAPAAVVPLAPAPSSIASSNVAAPAPADWLGVIGTGQSLSVGFGAVPITTTQPFHNGKLMLVDGTWTIAPLVEPIRPPPTGGDGQYPDNIDGETPHSALGNQLTALSLAAGAREAVTLHSVVGWGGHCLADLDKRGGRRAYGAGLIEMSAAARLARAAGKRFELAAVVLTHGECDANNPNYEAELSQLIRDYDEDARALPDQSSPVLLLLSQESTYPTDGAEPIGAYAQVSIGDRDPGRALCTGPRYPYVYLGDGVHLDAPSYRRLGEKTAEVLDRARRRHEAWAPLRPIAARREGGDSIVIDFHVPDPPLAWDEALPQPHQGAHLEWARGRGFEVMSARGPITITGANLRGDGVVLQLRDPPPSPLVVRYASIQDATRPAGGTEHGRMGQLRDSDPLVGWDAEELPCVVEQGSAVVRSSVPRAFVARTLRDRVDSDSLPAGAFVREKWSGETVVLSEPWRGPSGPAVLRFRHDLSNYAVSFRMTVP